jgi:hypothetical protein
LVPAAGGEAAMTWRDFGQLTPLQERDFKRANPQLGPDWKNYQAWVKSDGDVSRRKGHWKWTAVYSATIDGVIVGALREAHSQETPPTKDSPHKFKTGDFHLDRYSR